MVSTAARDDYQRTYLELVRAYPLKVLETDEDLDEAVAVLDSLLDRPEHSKAEQDYLDVLSHLVEAYETATIPEPLVSDAEMLRHLIEARGATQAQVAEDTGIAESTISEVLSGKRKLNRQHISRLAAYFEVGPQIFSFSA